MSQTPPSELPQTQTAPQTEAPPQASEVQSAPADPTSTQLVPIPVPVLPTQEVSPAKGILSLLLLLLVAVLLRTFWRLPQILERSGNDLVARLGGSYAIQNRILRAVGYLSVVGGFAMGNALGGLMLAAMLMIGVWVRPQGGIPDEE